MLSTVSIMSWFNNKTKFIPSLNLAYPLDAHTH